jgi:protein subunit release factor A
MWTRLLPQQRFTTPLSLSNVSQIPKLISSNLLKVGTVSMSSSPSPPPPDDPPKTRVPIVLLESDLEERFIKGGGAGGQKINKTASAVQLVHLPTGLRVETQRFRGLADNRKEARKLLRQRLDVLRNGPLSTISLRIAKLQRQKAKQRQRSEAKKKSSEGDSSQ